MSEGRFCPHCRKKLRSDNTKGMCSKCQARGRKLDGVYGEARAVKASTSAKTAQLPPRADADAGDSAEIMARFRRVTTALDLDPEAILAEAAKGWLGALQDALDGKEVED